MNRKIGMLYLVLRKNKGEITIKRTTTRNAVLEAVAIKLINRIPIESNSNFEISLLLGE